MKENETQEYIKQYEDLKRNRYIIEAIEPNFFFEIVDYLLKENEKWQKAYQEEKDKQFELIQNTNNTIKTANIAIKDLQEKWDRDTHKLQNDLDIANAEIVELIKEIERLKDINRIINRKGLEKNYEKALEKTMTKFLKNNIDKDFIPVQKVKDKIEELKRFIYTGENALQDFLQYRIKAKIQALQELIEEKGE